MRVILTHEQADFDAIAALLGARLLDEGALAVLPRRINRNARAFLTLYHGELPFVDPRDVPAETIEAVTLVDTQSLVTVKGFHKKTTVHVIDHHPRREDLSPGWEHTIERIGATTTLMIEALARRDGGALSVTEATLLLLGIYEDTGSLTYAGTTSRDVKAAAWLIEHGASLKILGQFLDLPLSEQQNEVYRRLMEDCSIEVIHGQRIAIARVQAESLTDEISSIAHKMREVLDPDGLFVLVSTVEGIRIVARSVSDRVNVARILGKFGGGGHDRAASCLIQPEEVQGGDGLSSLELLAEKIRASLREDIPPMITVEQIMSKKPHLIDPGTPAEKALALMTRYGYEGFPVAVEGKVVGLLTRRAVDRAISHKLNLPASRLMDAGNVTIRPDATIDQLRELVVTSGWGQIPVVSEASGDVVGIATRTDLIKIMAPTRTLQRHRNLAEKLEAALPAARLALLKAVMEDAGEHRMAVYIVGGFVRDLLLDRPGIDYDLVVEGDALGLGRSLAKKYGGRTITHSRFGTAKWFIQKHKPAVGQKLGLKADQSAELPDSLDLISARTEFYDFPTALPIVESSGIKLDLHRRDFTINTMALRLDGRHYGELHDYWGGLKDLHKGVIKVLHSLSFIDDPTRLLRAVRFEQRFGFKIEKRTLELMQDAFEVVRQVSGDRLRHEFNLILQEPRAGAILQRLDELGILQAIHPALGNLAFAGESLPIQLDPRTRSTWELPDEYSGMPIGMALGWLVWLSGLKMDALEQVSDRLRLPADLRLCLKGVLEIPGLGSEFVRQRPSAVVSKLEEYPLVAVFAARLVCQEPAWVKLLDRFAKKWRGIHPGVDGKDLMQMGLKPSPRFRSILERLRGAWLDGLVTDKAGEQVYLQTLIEESRSGDEDPGHGKR